MTTPNVPASEMRDGQPGRHSKITSMHAYMTDATRRLKHRVSPGVKTLMQYPSTRLARKPQQESPQAATAPFIAEGDAPVAFANAPTDVIDAELIDPDLDPAVEPHVIHRTLAHSESPAAHHAASAVVGFEWVIRLVLLGLFALLLYTAVSDNWFGSATQAFSGWYEEEVAPWLTFEMEDVIVPAEVEAPQEGQGLRTSVSN
ncbi:hypothetical protein [Demequina sediminicola]|uniref:hypothetical protein n=1 Tax=Demequina sediminicola TaxID=1095026 RepID=UPI000A642F57|nr:hypothetical protein [Demequina sediminicola]